MDDLSIHKASPSWWSTHINLLGDELALMSNNCVIYIGFFILYIGLTINLYTNLYARVLHLITRLHIMVMLFLRQLNKCLYKDSFKSSKCFIFWHASQLHSSLRLWHLAIPTITTIHFLTKVLNIISITNTKAHATHKYKLIKCTLRTIRASYPVQYSHYG